MTPDTAAAFNKARAELGEELAGDIALFVHHAVAALADRPDPADPLSRRLIAKAAELPAALRGPARVYAVVLAGELLELATVPAAGRC